MSRFANPTRMTGAARSDPRWPPRRRCGCWPKSPIVADLFSRIRLASAAFASGLGDRVAIIEANDIASHIHFEPGAKAQ